MTKEDILHHFQDINFYYNDCMMYDDLSRMLDELIAENKGEWIPTIERLPEYGQLVLCSVTDKHITGNKTYIIINERSDLQFWTDGTITAWQPLPEPYKAEKGGE